MDLGLLRTATTPEHERVEALMPLMSKDLTRATYIRVLQHMYPLLAGWEAWANESSSFVFSTCRISINESFAGLNQTC